MKCNYTFFCFLSTFTLKAINSGQSYDCGRGHTTEQFWLSGFVYYLLKEKTSICLNQCIPFIRSCLPLITLIFYPYLYCLESHKCLRRKNILFCLFKYLNVLTMILTSSDALRMFSLEISRHELFYWFLISCGFHLLTLLLAVRVEL